MSRSRRRGRLTEKFASFARWKPEDVNSSCDMLVERLTRHGVPVRVLEPELYLSIPYEASVEVDGEVLRAKPPAYSINLPEGREAELVYVPATYSKSVGTLFQKNQQAGMTTPERLRGKIVISEGFAFPQKIHEFEQAGAVGVIAVNPGVDIHWGICTSIWGTPDLDDLPRKPTIPVVAVNNPDGKRLIARAEAKGRVKIKTKLDEGWFKQKLPVVEIKGSEQPDKFVLLAGHYDPGTWAWATTRRATRPCWRSRGCCGSIAASSSARCASRGGRGIRPAAMPAARGSPTPSPSTSTRIAWRSSIAIPRAAATRRNSKDISWMKETERFAQGVIKEVAGLPSHGERPHRAGDYAFNNIGISSLFMLSSTMPDKLREEKSYYTVGGCGGNIAWHTENDLIDVADREIDGARYQGLSRRGAAHRQRGRAAIRLARQRPGIPGRGRQGTRRRRATASAWRRRVRRCWRSTRRWRVSIPVSSRSACRWPSPMTW